MSEPIQMGKNPKLHTRILVVMAFACSILPFLNMGCITAATPDLSGTFVVGALDVSWSGAACPLGTAMAFTGASYLWARIGLRRALRLALLMIAGASSAALVADHFLIMVVSRFLQGVGGGLALAYGTGLINAALPSEFRKLPMELRLCSIGAVSCISPVVGCLLVQYWNWRGLFVMIGTISVVLAILTTLFVPNQKVSKNGKFDWFSFLALGVGCVCILMVIIYCEIDGWTAPNVLAWMYGGFCAFVLVVISCMTHSTPLLDFRILSNWRFSLGLMASLCNIFCVCWMRAGTVQFMRNVMNYEPVMIACVFMVLVAGFLIGIVIVLPLVHKGVLALRIGMMAGLLGLGGCAFFMARLDAGCSWLDVAWPLGIFGVGYAFCINVGTPLALRGVPAKSLVSSARTLNTFRYVFISMYISSVSTVLAHVKEDYRFTVAERTRDNAPGTISTLDMWRNYLATTGSTPSDVNSGVDVLVQKAVSLQSQVFSADYFYLCAVMVGSAGILFALFCIKVKQERTSHS